MDHARCHLSLDPIRDIVIRVDPATALLIAEAMLVAGPGIRTGHHRDWSIDCATSIRTFVERMS